MLGTLKMLSGFSRSYSYQEDSNEPSSLDWAAILRNKTVLVEAGSRTDKPEVNPVAVGLLDKDPSDGWDTFSILPGDVSYRGGFKKGLKLHVYEGDQDRLTVWIFCIVYDTRRLSIQLAQAFVEQKMMMMTEVFRESDKSWRYGEALACQDVFGPILQQRLGEMKSASVFDSTLEAVLDDDLELSNAAILNNKTLIHGRRCDIKNLPSSGQLTPSAQECPASPNQSVETLDETEANSSSEDEVVSFSEDDIVSFSGDDVVSLEGDEAPEGMFAQDISEVHITTESQSSELLCEANECVLAQEISEEHPMPENQYSELLCEWRNDIANRTTLSGTKHDSTSRFIIRVSGWTVFNLTFLWLAWMTRNSFETKG